MSSDSEFAKMKFAMKSRRNKSNGFEGCKRCSDGGFYLATYSREGYCRDCELECFPERFFPCPCCRLPLSLKMLCLACTTGLNKFIGDTGCGTSEEAKRQSQEWRRKRSMMEQYPVKDCAAGDFIRSFDLPTTCSNGDVLPPGSSLPHVTKLGSAPRFCHSWPGFYMGNGVWEKLTYMPQLDDYGIVIQQD